MFRCDHCHTEYGGIRGLDSGSCPRCHGGQAQPERRDWSTRPFAAAPVRQPAESPLRRAG
jgi:hypothetical protein